MVVSSGKQPLELLFARVRKDGCQGVAVLARMIGQEAGQIALQRGLAFPPTKLDMEGLQEVRQRCERCTGSPW
jgi:hypothetical protein